MPCAHSVSQIESYLQKSSSLSNWFSCRVEIQELKLEESAQMIAELTERLKQYEVDIERMENVRHNITTNYGVTFVLPAR